MPRSRDDRWLMPVMGTCYGGLYSPAGDVPASYPMVTLRPQGKRELLEAMGNSLVRRLCETGCRDRVNIVVPDILAKKDIKRGKDDKEEEGEECLLDGYSLRSPHYKGLLLLTGGRGRSSVELRVDLEVESEPVKFDQDVALGKSLKGIVFRNIDFRLVYVMHVSQKLAGEEINLDARTVCSLFKNLVDCTFVNCTFSLAVQVANEYHEEPPVPGEEKEKEKKKKKKKQPDEGKYIIPVVDGPSNWHGGYGGGGGDGGGGGGDGGGGGGGDGGKTRTILYDGQLVATVFHSCRGLILYGGNCKLDGQAVGKDCSAGCIVAVGYGCSGVLAPSKPRRGDPRQLHCRTRLSATVEAVGELPGKCITALAHCSTWIDCSGLSISGSRNSAKGFASAKNTAEDGEGSAAKVVQHFRENTHLLDRDNDFSPAAVMFADLTELSDERVM